MRLLSILFFLLFACISRPIKAQVFEDFHDQNQLEGLIWGGDLFEVVSNTNRQLQLYADSGGTTQIYFETTSQSNELECQFWLRHNFSGSSLNYSQFYLRADQSDLSNAPNALFLEFGEAGTQDAVKVILRINGIDSLLAQGPAGSIASAFQLFFDFQYAAGVFTLNVRNSMADANTLWCSGPLPWLPAGPFVGIAMIYTSSNKHNFFLDDIYCGPIRIEAPPRLLITEIMADPEPSKGLPSVEYLELFNAGEQTQQLSAWTLEDANGVCTLPSFWLHPGMYCTLVANTQSGGFNHNSTIELSAFPNLNNTTEQLTLQNPQANYIESVSYSIDWHTYASAQDGGVSLERRSLLDLCSSADNWGSCEAILGGTPGSVNSIFDLDNDTIAPHIIKGEITDSLTLNISFSEPVDTLIVSTMVVNFSQNLGTYFIEILPYDQNLENPQLILHFESVLPKSVPIQVTLFNLADCWGNVCTDSIWVIGYQSPMPGDLVINEILFDPPAFGADFLELYNATDKYLDLLGIQLSNGVLEVLLPELKLAPNELVALCADTLFLLNYYPATTLNHLAQMTLPAFYNDSGTCILVKDGLILDKLHYEQSWHSPLIGNTEGVSLERLSALEPTQSIHNWFSASQQIGFATPGSINSQQLGNKLKGSLTLTHPELSPDQDGYHDFLEIHYQLPQPNMLVQADIYSLNGAHVKRLVEDQLFGTSGVLIWDGSTQYGTIAPFGIYILDFKAFSTDPGVFFGRKLSFVRCIKH